MLAGSRQLQLQQQHQHLHLQQQQPVVSVLPSNTIVAFAYWQLCSLRAISVFC
jgi:hypothetical protein